MRYRGGGKFILVSWQIPLRREDHTPRFELPFALEDLNIMIISTEEVRRGEGEEGGGGEGKGRKAEPVGRTLI